VPAPLDGVRVLDLSTILAAPLACAVLGEFGAEVIKVEQPTGGDPTRHYPPTYPEDGESVAWAQYGRGKRSVTVDLHHPEGRELVLRLVATCDVVVVNFRPATVRRFGIDFDDLRAVRHDVVMLHLSAFGRTGPYADRPGFARVAEGFAGLTHRTGDPEGPPRFAGYPVADGVAGYYVALSALLALRARDASGEPQLVDVALYEPLLRMLEDFVPIHRATGTVLGPVGNANPAIAPNGLFPTRDDRWLVLPASTNQMWARLLDVMDAPELSRYTSMHARVENRETIHAAVAEFTRAHDLDWLVGRLTEAGIAAGPVNTVADLVADAHIAARGSVLDTTDRTGRPVSVLRPAGVFSGFDLPDLAPAPALGQDTDAVLAELGYTSAEVEELRRRGAV
jgi:crotonobetainyl-CoA:carnitine CoA-transferase CaiB-like acyl-CoA transferase